MPRPLAPEQRAAILEAIRAGGQSCRGLAKAHGVSTTVVRKIAAENGITDAWSRDRTKKATEAKAIDHAAVLVKLASRSAGVALSIRSWHAFWKSACVMVMLPGLAGGFPNSADLSPPGEASYSSPQTGQRA